MLRRRRAGVADGGRKMLEEVTRTADGEAVTNALDGRTTTDRDDANELVWQWGFAPDGDDDDDPMLSVDIAETGCAAATPEADGPHWDHMLSTRCLLWLAAARCACATARFTATLAGTTVLLATFGITVDWLGAGKGDLASIDEEPGRVVAALWGRIMEDFVGTAAAAQSTLKLLLPPCMVVWCPYICNGYTGKGW